MQIYLALTNPFIAACSTESNSIQPIQGPSTNPPERSDAESSSESQSDLDKQTQSEKTPATPTQNCEKQKIGSNKYQNIQFLNTAGVEPHLQSLDVHMPEISQPCEGVPIVIWVHGGAWMIGDKSQIGYKAKHFNSLGYGFISVNYRLSPNITTEAELTPDRIQFPDHPTDVGAAVGWIYKNIRMYGGNPDKLALLGHSAGAHLAALVALNQSYITQTTPQWSAKSLRCVGSYDTEAYDVTTAIQEATGSQLLFYRNAFGTEASNWAAASPINHVKNLELPFQLARRGNAQRQNILRRFKDALETQKNSVSIIEASALSHEEVNRVIGNPTDQIMTPQVTKFLKDSCFNK